MYARIKKIKFYDDKQSGFGLSNFYFLLFS